MDDKRLNDFKDTIIVLEKSIELFYQGYSAFYRVIANQLRLLLCDTQRKKDNSLLPRLFIGVKLHPMRGLLTKEAKEALPFLHGKGEFFQIPAQISFDGKGGSKIEVLFDEGKPRIPLADWLDQGIFNEKITVRELIRSVSDKEAVHSDKDYNETLKTTRSIKLVTEDIHIKFIVAIGEYILKDLKKQDFKHKYNPDQPPASTSP